MKNSAAARTLKPRILAIANQKGVSRQDDDGDHPFISSPLSAKRFLSISIRWATLQRGWGLPRRATTYDALMGEYRLEAAVIDSDIPDCSWLGRARSPPCGAR
ncbi:MAG: hypothetical protein R3C42_04670 [Parvularculaceae bacterium]